jgi:hypothetical protein
MVTVTLPGGLQGSPRRPPVLSFGMAGSTATTRAVVVFADGELAKELGGLSTVLSDASAAERAKVYASLDLRLDYDPHQRRVKATAHLSRVAGRVRGGT